MKFLLIFIYKFYCIHNLINLIYLTPIENSSSIKWTKESVENFRNSIEDLIIIRSILRQYSPDFNVTNSSDAKQINRLLKRSAKVILPLFETLGLYQEKLGESNQITEGSKGKLVKSGVELVQTIGDDFVFVGSNNIKKILKNLGVEANKIIVAGGPMNIDDMKELNPSMTPEALENYQKKIQSVVNTLKRTVENGKTIKFIMANQDESDQLIASCLLEIEQQIGSTMVKIMVQTWDKI